MNPEEKLYSFVRQVLNSEEQCLITLQLILIDYCICKCKGCEHWNWPTKTKLSLDIIKNNIISQFQYFPRLESIVLSGGESLLHDDLEEIVKALKASGKNIGIISSGLGKKNIDWKVLSENCSWIRFSIDGFSDENYFKTRGVHLLGQWKNNLKTLLEQNKKTTCKTRLNTIIHEYNINYFTDNLIEFMNEINEEIIIYFWLSRDIIDLFKNNRTSDKAKQYYDIIFSKINKLKNESGELFKLFNFDFVNRHFTPTINTKYKSCYIGNIFGEISAEGNVFPCCYMYEPVFSYNKQHLDFSIGNIYESTLHEIYSSEKFKKVTSILKQKGNSLQQCEYCDRYNALNLYLNTAEINTSPVFI